MAELPTQLSVENFLERLGGYSWFQLWATIVIIAPEISAAMIALSPILTGSSNVFFQCVISHSSANGTVLSTGEEMLPSQMCQTVCNGTWRPVGHPTSIVQEWDLYCSRAWFTDSLTSLQMFGSMTGAIFAAQFADRFGRKRAFFILCFLMGVFGFISGCAPNVTTYAMARFIAGFAVGGCFVVYLNYLMEFLTPSYRTICGCVSLWAVGEMLLALFGYLLPQWRQLSAAASLPVLLIFLAYPLIPESPRWLLCQEKTDEAIKVFNQIAKWNGKPCIDSTEIHMLQKSFSAEKPQEDQPHGLSQCLNIMRNKDYRIQLLVFMFAWFSNSVVYYGFSFNMKNLSGNPYLNVFYLGLTELPGCLSGIYFNNRFGRRRTFLGFLLLGTMFMASLVVVDMTSLSSHYPSLVVIFCQLGRYCSSASFAVLACFTAESFPTVSRITCMGLCALSGNIGGILAPQLCFLGTIFKTSHYIVFCVLTFTTAAGSLILNDMNGKPLQDNLPKAA